MRYGRTLPRIAAVTAALTVAGCGSKAPEDAVLARVGDRTITVGDFGQAYLSISVPSRPDLSAQEGRLAFLNDLINKEILIGEGEKRGLTFSPALEQGLQALEAALVQNALDERVIKKDIEVTSEEVHTEYERSKTELLVSHVLCPNPERAAAAMKELDAGKPFDQTAIKFSVDPRSAKSGGDLGWGTAGSWVRGFEDAAYALEPGKHSQVVPTEYGYHIILVREKRPRDVGSFDDEKLNLSKLIRKRKEAEAHSQYLGNLRVQYDVDAVPEGVRALAEVVRRMEIDRIMAWSEVAARVPPEVQALPILQHKEGTWTVGEFLTRQGGAALLGSPGQAGQPSFLEQIVLQKGMEEVQVLEGKKLGLQNLLEVKAEVDRRREQYVVYTVHDAVTADVTIPPEAVREHYEKNLPNLVRPEMVTARKMSLQSETEANRVLRRLKRGEEFQKVAAEASHDPLLAPEARGLPKPYPRGTLPPETEEAVFKLKAGDLSRPVESVNGYWEIYKVESHDPEREYTFEEAKDAIQQQLLEWERDKVFNEWIRNQRQELHVEIDEKALQGLDVLGIRPPA